MDASDMYPNLEILTSSEFGIWKVSRAEASSQVNQHPTVSATYYSRLTLIIPLGRLFIVLCCYTFCTKQRLQLDSSSLYPFDVQTHRQASCPFDYVTYGSLFSVEFFALSCCVASTGSYFHPLSDGFSYGR